MSNTTESPQPGSLEYFNRPENFLADTANLDIQIVRQGAGIKRGSYDIFMHPDGVRVKIEAYKDRETGVTTYQEELSRPHVTPEGKIKYSEPDSPFKYTNVYDAQGLLVRKLIRFYGWPFGSAYEFKNGRLVSTAYVCEPVHPLEKTREAMLKEIGIDLFDPSQIWEVYISNKKGDFPFHLIIFKKRYSRAFIDPETGKIIFEAAYYWGDEGGTGDPGERMEDEKEEVYQKVEKLIREKVPEDAPIYAIYRKLRANNRNRFFEVFLQKKNKNWPRDLTSYLVDLKTGEILHQVDCLVALPFTSTPSVELFDEYTQHLKMLEVEKR